MTEYDEVEADLRYAWLDYAACLDPTDDDYRLIFPWKRPEPTEEETDAWIAGHCGECPVRDRCIDFAAQTGSFGIWGGFRIEPGHAAKLQRLHNRKGYATVEDAEHIVKGQTDD